MLAKIVGNSSAAQVLTYLYRFEEGYAVEIARFYNCALSPIQNQLQRFEQAGVLTWRYVGRTKLYFYSERSSLVGPLKEIVAHFSVSEPVLFQKSDTIEINWEED